MEDFIRWLDIVNKRAEEIHIKSKINSILLENDIDTL